MNLGQQTSSDTLQSMVLGVHCHRVTVHAGKQGGKHMGVDRVAGREMGRVHMRREQNRREHAQRWEEKTKERHSAFYVQLEWASRGREVGEREGGKARSCWLRLLAG